MNGKCAIVGDGDFIMVFKACGVAAFPCNDAKKAKDILRKIAHEYNIIFLSEALHSELTEFLKRFDEMPYPVVTSIPMGENTGYSYELLKSAMGKALGVDILFHN